MKSHRHVSCLLSVLLITLVTVPIVTAQIAWVPMGPFGGHCTDIAATSDGTLYAYSYGVYRSTNHGASWEPTGYYGSWDGHLLVSDSAVFVTTFSDLYRVDCQPPRFIPRDGSSNTLVSIDHDGRLFRTGDSHTNFHFFRSTDYGEHWTVIDTSLSTYGSRIGAFPDNSLITSGINQSRMTNFRSTDHGEHWSVYGTPDHSLAVEVLQYALGEDGIGCAATDRAVQYTSDSGISWNVVFNIPINGYIEKIGLQGDQRFHFLTYTGGDSSTFFWMPAASGSYVPTVFHHRMYSFESNDALGPIFAGEYPGIWRADSSGNIAPFGDSLNSLNCRRIFVDANNRIHCFAGIDTSFFHFYSDDIGMQWTRAVCPSNIYYANCVITNNYWYALSTSNNEIFHSSDGGLTWYYHATIPTRIAASNLVAFDDGTLVTSTYNSLQMHYSSDAGTSWHAFGFPDSTDYELIYEFTAIDTSVIVGLTNGTISGTYRWSLHDSLRLISPFTCQRLASKGLDGMYYWWMTDSVSQYSLYLSSPDWTTLLHIPLPDSLSEITPLAVDAAGQLYLQRNGITWMSSDRGQHWTQITTGLPYTSSDENVFYESNTVTELAIHPVTGVLLAGMTHGIFRTASSVTSVAESHRTALPTILALSNYPNPFNGSTVVSFTVPHANRVTVAIYNVNGELVTKLLNKSLAAGEHSVRWNAEGISSGVYFCKVISGNLNATRKLILVK